MEPIYWWLIGGAVVIVIAGAVAVYFTGRKKEEPLDVGTKGNWSPPPMPSRPPAIDMTPDRDVTLAMLERLRATAPTVKPIPAEPTVPMSVHLAAIQRLTRTPAQLHPPAVEAQPDPVIPQPRATRGVVGKENDPFPAEAPTPVDAGPSDPHKDAMAAIRVRLLEIMKG